MQILNQANILMLSFLKAFLICDPTSIPIKPNRVKLTMFPQSITLFCDGLIKSSKAIIPTIQPEVILISAILFPLISH